MKNKAILLLAFCLSLVACAPPTPTLSNTPMPSATETPPIPAWQATNTAVFATLLVAPTPTPKPTPTPSYMYDFDSGVRADQRQLIVNGIDLGRHYYGEVRVLTVYAYTDPKSLCDVYSFHTGRGCDVFKDAIGLGGPAEIILNLNSEDWEKNPVFVRTQIVVHEYVHVLQFHLTYPGLRQLFVRPSGGIWLEEGAAEYLSWRVIFQETLVNPDLVRTYNKAQAGKIRASLAQLETREEARAAGVGSEYILGCLAAEYLADHYGGYQAFLKYFELLGSGVGWRSAFETGFRIPLFKFYDQFEEYRRANFPPQR